MRNFWCRTCSSSNDIPEELIGVRFAEEDVVEYSKTGNWDDGVKATNLRGMARKTLPRTIADKFYQHVRSVDEKVYSWDIRGPRIYDQLQNADIVALHEYDCHDVTADYRGTCESFSEAMSKDWDGAFLKDPLLDRDPPSGGAIFWKRNAFETISNIGGIETVDCNETGFEGAVVNIDLEERHHPIGGDGTTIKQTQPILMRAADRRNGAFVKLRHLSSGRIVVVCSAHLMTTSRDSAKQTHYPGEVRAGELVALKQLVENELSKDDGEEKYAVVLMGDFNVNAKDAIQIFSGNIPNNDSTRAPLSLDTGFDVNTKTFQWGDNILSDTFEDVHQWGKNVKERGVCTSKNAVRTEWIDYIMHNNDVIKPVQLSDCSTPSEAIPSDIHPSDHIPVHATFQFI